MSGCTVEWIDDKHVKISGTIDEYADFDELIAKFPDEVWIDFGEIKRINSSGVRQWLKAVMTSESRIHFVNCAAPVVDQLTLVPHFLGKNGVVDSFEVLFFCYNCDHEIQRFFQIGKDIDRFSGPTPTFNDVFKCDTCGGDVEVAHNVDIYFSFLRDDTKKSG